MRLIDADAAKEKACEKWTYVGTKVVRNFLDAQATIDVVPVVHGRWEILEEANMFDACGNNAKYVACTNCGFRWNDIYSAKNYFERCPSCGAKMDAPV
ncbi:MAG: hypothetical protein RR365_14165 [Bacteroides sp.]